jgi:hypothetical protein
VNAVRLIDAYHTIFDFKDQQKPGSQEAGYAYMALKALEPVIVAAGGEVPKRFDRKRD